MQDDQKEPLEVDKKSESNNHQKDNAIAVKLELMKKDELEHGMSRLKVQNQGSGSDYDKAGQSSSNVDSGRGSAVYSSGRRPPPEDQKGPQGKIRLLIFQTKQENIF